MLYNLNCISCLMYSLCAHNTCMIPCPHACIYCYINVHTCFNHLNHRDFVRRQSSKESSGEELESSSECRSPTQ